MNTKQIVFTNIGVAELIDTALNEPDEQEVLIETEFSAVSAGTERANLMGDPNISGNLNACVSAFPRTLGYSSAGIVRAIGSKVDRVAVGDRVVAYFGKHRSFNLLPQTEVVRVPEGAMRPEEAALAVILSFSGEGVHKCQLEFGQSALVMGLGILGLGAVQLCRIAGAVPVIAADPNPDRRALALELGADEALDPTDKDFCEQVTACTDGTGANAVIEVSGRADVLRSSLGCSARMGRVCLLGCIRQPVDQVDFYHEVHHKGVQIIGANDNARPRTDSAPGNWTFRDEIGALIRMTRLGRFSFDGLISEIHSPQEAHAVYGRLAEHPESFPVGVLFDWRGQRA